MPYLVYSPDKRVRRRLNSWFNPGPRHKRLPEGVMLGKVGSLYLMSDDEFSIRLIGHLKHREGDVVRVFYAEERSLEELTEELSG